jgi:hypothetical protein
MGEILKISSIGANSPNFDLEACNLPPEIFSYAKNYLVRDNEYRAFNTEQNIYIGAGTPTLPGYIDFIQKSPTEYFYLVGGSTQVKVFDLLNWVDISNLAGYPVVTGFEDSWEGCKLGSIPVLTNYNAFPEYWSPQVTAQKMQDLKFDAANTWRAKNYKCKVIRSHLNFLFALGLKEGSTEYPNAYRWSHPADIGGLPFSWDELDTSTIASKEFLDDEYIIDGCSLRNEFAIYTNRGIHILTYRGESDTPFVRRKLSTTQSLIASKCVVEAAGSNYFLANGDILRTEGSVLVSVLDKRFKNFLKDSLSQTFFQNCYATVNSNTKEIWFFIVQYANRYPNIALVVNYNDNNVSIRDIQFGRTHACFGLVQDPNATVEAWNTESTQVWPSNSQPWNDNLSTPFDYRIINCETNGIIETPEPLSNYINTLQSYNTVLERTNIQLDNTEEKTTITRFTPQLSSTGKVKIEVGSHDFLDANVRWKPAVIFDPKVNRKVDIRTTGDLHAWRISSVGLDGFTLYGFDVVYETAGKRIGGFIPAVAR